MTDRLPCAILGASGYIGQHFARLLDGHPQFEVEILGAGDRSVGTRLEDRWLLAEEVPSSLYRRRLQSSNPAALRRAGIVVVFSALPSGTAGAIESALVRRGVSVFTNASDHRMDPSVPLLVPEVNASHLRLVNGRPAGNGLLVANPNCTAAGLVLALAPLLPLLRPRSVHVATYQALSGAGYPGVPSLTILDNVVPFIPGEEEKVDAESRRILGRPQGSSIRPRQLVVLTHCARVGTREGHLEAVTLECRKLPSSSAIERAWSEFRPLAELGLPTAPRSPLILRRELDRPQPVKDRWAGEPERARGMAATLGRVRWTPPFLRFFVLSNNAVRGGAGGSVLNAELSIARGALGPEAHGG